MESQRRYWFPAKKYGWGWGPPSVWQGWVVLLAYVALVLGGMAFIDPKLSTAKYLAYVFVLSLALTVICWRTGEPPRWRWGKR